MMGRDAIRKFVQELLVRDSDTDDVSDMTPCC